jgi:hypothetical protein
VGILDRLFGASDRTENNVRYVYVRCQECGEVIQARVHLVNDLSADYSKRKASYHVRKTIVGSERCFRPIEIELAFNDKRRLVNQSIEGGEFITQREYKANSAEHASQD